ncbi:MAG: hypothetical protein HY721_35295, partial [Planctomycetes bacterium]|nr:hypothetical protein [Planctomycetota bacterium]
GRGRARAGEGGPVVTAPPAAFFELVRERHRDAARRFYRKHVDAGGIPVVASAQVADQALLRARSVVTGLLAGRPDIVAALVKDGMYLIIIGKDQVYTDMPEYRDHPDPTYQNERVRGTGGKPTSFGEENLLSLPLDRYDDESIAVHELCHSVVKKGLWKGTAAARDRVEAWAQGVLAYFDAAGRDAAPAGAPRPIATRELLEAYDPELHALVHETMAYEGRVDWRYEP